MEFEELQKIWDEQNGQTLFVLNEAALHNRIAMKKSKAHHVVNFTELLLIVVNLGAAVWIAALNLSSRHANVFMYMMAAWMFIVSVTVFIKRQQRTHASKRFDRTMIGDLEQAIDDANWQVRLSQLMRWNIVPIALLSLLGMWRSDKSIWLMAGFVIIFILAHFASRWEHGVYKSRKRELEVLRGKLGES